MERGNLSTKDYIKFQLNGHSIEKASRALPGDYVEALNGEVTSILTRSPFHQHIVGVLEVAAKARYGFTPRGIPIYLFIPWNEAYPPFYVGSSHKDTSKNLLAAIQFESWLPGTNCPRGSVERIIGVSGTQAAEEEGLLIHACPYPWKKGVVAGTPLVTPVISPTTTTAFHVDPPGCRDIDDALTISLDGDVADIQIHIADVAAVLALNPWLNHAANIGQTIYKDGVIQIGMFPVAVEEACSLLPGTTRNALTLRVKWDLTSGTQVGEPQWINGSIRVTESYTYDTIVASDRAPLLRQITSSIAKRDLDDAHDWIAELMILYNTTAAQALQRGALGILRRHAPPAAQPATPLLLPKYMSYKAGEYCSPDGDDVNHWGLQKGVYCHASSPIRRWADCINQLSLKRILGTEVTIPDISIEGLNLAGKRVRAYERDIFFVNALLGGEQEIDGVVIQVVAGGPKARIWVPAWNRIITIRNSDLEKSEPGENVRGRVFVQTGQRNWKRRIVFELTRSEKLIAAGGP